MRQAIPYETVFDDSTERLQVPRVRRLWLKSPPVSPPETWQSCTEGAISSSKSRDLPPPQHLHCDVPNLKMLYRGHFPVLPNQLAPPPAISLTTLPDQFHSLPFDPPSISLTTSACDAQTATHSNDPTSCITPPLPNATKTVAAIPHPTIVLWES
jgi:hypothetical protein